MGLYGDIDSDPDPTFDGLVKVGKDIRRYVKCHEYMLLNPHYVFTKRYRITANGLNSRENRENLTKSTSRSFDRSFDRFEKRLSKVPNTRGVIRYKKDYIEFDYEYGPQELGDGEQLWKVYTFNVNDLFVYRDRVNEIRNLTISAPLFVEYGFNPPKEHIVELVKEIKILNSVYSFHNLEKDVVIDSNLRAVLNLLQYKNKIHLSFLDTKLMVKGITLTREELIDIVSQF